MAVLVTGAIPWWRRRDGLWLVLLAALVLRLGWALLVPVRPVSDPWMYHFFARSIAEGRGYVIPSGEPTAFWPVGAGAFYGGLFALFGDRGATVAVANLAMGVVLVGCVHELARRYFGGAAALVAGLIAVCWPTWIQFTTIPSSDLLFTLLTVGALLVRGKQPPAGMVRTILSTLLVVAAIYVRPIALPLVVLLPLLDGVQHRRPALALRDTVLAVALAAALIAPWAERNRQVFGRPVLISTNFGTNLWQGNNRFGTEEPPGRGTVDEATWDDHLKREAVDFIRTHPVEYLTLSLKRAALSFGRETAGVHWNLAALPAALVLPLKLLSTLYWWCVLLLAAGGAWLWLRERPMRLIDPLVFMPALFASTTILIHAADRYHMPMMPFMAGLAAVALLRIREFLRRPRASVPTAQAELS